MADPAWPRTRRGAHPRRGLKAAWLSGGNRSSNASAAARLWAAPSRSPPRSAPEDHGVRHASPASPSSSVPRGDI
jgi:hypothetical protein